MWIFHYKLSLSLFSVVRALLCMLPRRAQRRGSVSQATALLGYKHLSSDSIFVWWLLRGAQGDTWLLSPISSLVSLQILSKMRASSVFKVTFILLVTMCWRRNNLKLQKLFLFRLYCEHTVQQMFKHYFRRVGAIFCEALPVADADDWVSMSPRHRPCSEIIGMRGCRPSASLCWSPAQRLARKKAKCALFCPKEGAWCSKSGEHLKFRLGDLTKQSVKQ